VSLWFYENQTPHLEFCTRVKKTLHTETTQFQELKVLDTYEFGRVLVLDGAIQTSVQDEFIYHEMLTHVPLYTHPNPQRVLVIGGGDGGTIREVLKHDEVKEAHLVEIDRRVVETAQEYLPEISGQLAARPVEIFFEDGLKFIQKCREEYDVILVDSPDQVGPAVELFSGEFYRDIHKALKPDGLFVAQTESPFFNQDLIHRVFNDVKDIFPVARLYLTSIPTYPGGAWTFTLGSKEHHPLSFSKQDTAIATRYYTPRLHRAAFVLPRFLEEILEKGPEGSSGAWTTKEREES
jgi:spermidine synthase